MSQNYKDRMETFVKRMIQRPNKINAEYKNINDHDYKDAMKRDLSQSIVQYDEFPLDSRTIDASSYHAITPAIIQGTKSYISIGYGSTRKLSQGSPIRGTTNPILGYDGSLKSLSVMKNGLRQALQPPMQFGKYKKSRHDQVMVSSATFLFFIF